MVQITGSRDVRKVDISFMYSLRCNLSCPFCMYDAGPERKETMNLDTLDRFIRTIKMDEIDTFGLYGGEPTLYLLEYQRIVDMLPRSINKFMISNGWWTKWVNGRRAVLEFLERNDITCFISRNRSQREIQDEAGLKSLADYPLIRIKESDSFIPMGRLAGTGSCSEQCLRWRKPLRLAIRPDHDVYFQCCDGSYPIIGNIEHDDYEELVVRGRGILAGRCPDVALPVAA